MKNILDVLKERGFVKQTVYEEELREKLESGMVSFYTGIDPTANSMTIGHFMPMLTVMHLQRAGHKPYILVGGGTAHIGDPTGKTEMRKMMTKETIDSNVQAIQGQLKNYLNFEGENSAVFVNNADWLLKLNYVDFIRDIGSIMSVNRMLGADCFKSRYEKGLSFLEFNYMPMQAYDFLYLNKNYNVSLQIGGDDQWSNMLAGVDLVRRKEKNTAYSLTMPLLLTPEGKKMGKSEKGALWIDKERTSPYEIYQYLRNTADSKVEEFLKRMTFLSLEEIAELTKYQDERINVAKDVLAFEFIKLIHGEEDAILARSQSQAAFGKGDIGEMPTMQIELNDDKSIINILVSSKICKSNGEARRLIQAGAIKINERKITEVFDVLTSEEISEKTFVLHKGKKVHLKVSF